MLPQATRVLMEGTPANLNIEELISSVEQIDGVEGIHHLHVWELDEQNRALEAHVVVVEGNATELERVNGTIKKRLADGFGIYHSTLELEIIGDANFVDSETILYH